MYFRPKSVIFPALFQTWSKIWYRISDLEPGMWLEPMTSCYGTYTVVGINIKREMVLSPNDEEVANSSKKHTQFKTRRHKPYPVSDQNGRNWYPISNQKKKTFWHGTYLYSLQVVYKGLPPPPPPPPPGRKKLLVLLLMQVRLIIAELSCVQSMRSRAPLVTKFGRLSIRENLVMT